MTLAAALVALTVAVVAVAWPYIPRLRSAQGLSASDRASWVNRLFALVSVAEESGETQVAEAARQLIATLVHQQPSGKRGR